MDWWRRNRTKFPEASKAARCFFSLQPTSSGARNQRWRMSASIWHIWWSDGVIPRPPERLPIDVAAVAVPPAASASSQKNTNTRLPAGQGSRGRCGIKWKLHKITFLSVALQLQTRISYGWQGGVIDAVVAMRAHVDHAGVSEQGCWGLMEACSTGAMNFFCIISGILQAE